MKTSLLIAFGLVVMTTASGHADVFSSQTFDGGSATLDALPGVNLDIVPGMNGSSGNCSETMVPSYSGSFSGETRATTCRYGNFSVTTSGTNPARNHLDLTYGGNPPPWEQGWRP